MYLANCLHKIAWCFRWYHVSDYSNEACGDTFRRDWPGHYLCTAKQWLYKTDDLACVDNISNNSLSPWSWYISVNILTASESNARFGWSTTPRAYNWCPKARFPNTNCAALVRSRQSTQLVLQMPFCSDMKLRHGALSLLYITINNKFKITRTKILTLLHSEGSVNKARIPNEKSLSFELIPQQHLQGSLWHRVSYYMLSQQQLFQLILEYNSRLVRMGHIPGSIFHPLLQRQELIQIIYTLSIFIPELWFTRRRFMLLDQIQYGDGSAVSLKEIVEMSRGCCEERVDDTD